MDISAWNSEAGINVTASENALAYIGLKLVRSGLYSVNTAAFVQLNHDLGIKYDFMVSGGSTTMFSQSLQAIEANSSIIAFVEGPNESDEPGETTHYDGLTGLAATAAEMRALDAAVKSHSQLKNIPIIQASFGIPASFAEYGNHAGTANYTSSHIYYNLFPFGTDPLHRNGLWMKTLLADAQIVTPGVPNIVTETGYETLPGTSIAVSLIDQAKYLLDDVFDLWNAGVPKTFIFTLVDQGPSSPNPLSPSNNYGIYNADWTPKPAAIALHNLTTLLADSGTGGVSPGSLNYSLSGATSTMHTTLLEKSNGTFVLAIWNDVQLQNTAGVDTAVASIPVTLTLANTVKSITVYDPLTGTGAIESIANARTIKLMVPDHPVLVEISNTAAAGYVAPANAPIIYAPTEVLAAGDSIVQVGGVRVRNDNVGIITVRVTDSHGRLEMQDANWQALNGSGTDSITLAGSAAIVNAELGTLVYTAANAGGGDTISVQATGNGVTRNDFITVNAISRPAYAYTLGPLLSLPSKMTVGTGARVAIPEAILTDDYYATHAGSLTLTVYSANGTTQMLVNGTELAAAHTHTVTGSYATIAADLASLTYTAAGTRGTDTLSFHVTDDGGAHSTRASMPITVNWDLFITGTGAVTLAKGATGKVAVQIDDAQKAGNADSLQVTVSDVTGTLSMLGGSGAKLGGSGSHSITLSGTPDWVNSELSTLTETAPSAGAADTVTVKVRNAAGVATSSSFHIGVVSAASVSLRATVATPAVAVASDTVAVRAVAAALAVSAPSSVAAGSGMVVPVTGLSVADSKAAADGLQITAVLSDRYGKLSMTDAAGDAVAGAGGHTLTLRGSLAAVNAELAGLTYSAPEGTVQDSISVAASDTAGGSGSQGIAIATSPAGTLPAYFQLADTAGHPLGRQAFLQSGAMVLTSAATGLNGRVSEQVSGGTFTLTATQWNAVSAASVTELRNTSSAYVLNNFRTANADLEAGPTGAGQAQTLTINTAQNGTIALGSGNQRIIINAGLGGSTTSSNKTFKITEGSGADYLKVTGYAGYLPSGNVANITNAVVAAGAGTATMDFINAHASVQGGSGNLTLYGSNYGTGFTAGTGIAKIWGGTGWNAFVYHSGDGLMTIEDFNAKDTLVLDSSLRAGMHEKTVSGGVELTFAASPHSEILLKGQTADLSSRMTWHA